MPTPVEPDRPNHNSGSPEALRVHQCVVTVAGLFEQMPAAGTRTGQCRVDPEPVEHFPPDSEIVELAELPLKRFERLQEFVMPPSRLVAGV